MRDLNKIKFGVSTSYERYLLNTFSKEVDISGLPSLINRCFIVGLQGSGKTEILKSIQEKLESYSKKTVIFISPPEITSKEDIESVIREKISINRAYFDNVVVLIDGIDELKERNRLESFVKFLNTYHSLSVIITVKPSTLISKSVLTEVKQFHFAQIQLPETTTKTKRYWAGGFGKHEGAYDRLEKFKTQNYWQALDYELDGDNKNVADTAWRLFAEIKIGDWFLIKGYGGGQNMNVHYIGEVINKNNKDGRLEFKSFNIEPFSTNPPKGEGAGNWFLTLLEVYRDDDIKFLFHDKIANSKSFESKSDEKQFIIGESDFVISEDDEAVIGVSDLALIMANLLKKLKDTDKGKMVGIFGNWGRGKTFLMNKIWKVLDIDSTKPFIRIDFHAWKYQDTPASWAYLYESFAKEYFKDDTNKWRISKELNKIGKIICLNYKRLGVKPILLSILYILLAAIGYRITRDYNQVLRLFLFFGGISLSTLQVLSIIKRSFSKEAKDLFNKYYTKTSFVNLLGVQAEIQNELKLLLKTWLPETNNASNKRILLFVDDIDRCNEEHIIMIIDALRIMLEDEEISKRVVVVAAIDERVLKRTIKWKYHDLLAKDNTVDDPERKILAKNITNEYMDKLFLSGISLGVLTSQDRKSILSKYIGKRVFKIQNPSTEIKQEEKDEEQSLNEVYIANRELLKTNKESKDGIMTFEGGITAVDFSKFDLVEDEEKMLNLMMDYAEDLTPRQIRIYYYRYLLARNILNGRISGRDTNLDLSLLNMLAEFLMHYTINGNNIKTRKMEFIKDSSVGAQIEILGSLEMYNINELILIHEVLETVVAY